MAKVLEPDVEVSDHSSVPDVFVKPKKNWKSNLWDTFDKSPEERRFLFKLDAGLLTICCLGTARGKDPICYAAAY